MTRSEFNNYTYPDTGETRMLITSEGFELQSYKNYAIYTTAAGLNQGDPVYTWAYQNFTNTKSPTASCQCMYDLQLCSCASIEG